MKIELLLQITYKSEKTKCLWPFHDHFVVLQPSASLFLSFKVESRIILLHEHEHTERFLIFLHVYVALFIFNYLVDVHVVVHDVHALLLNVHVAGKTLTDLFPPKSTTL